MTLDSFTLRVCLGVVSLLLFALFYGVTYRSTRAPYAGMWSLALLLFMAGSAAYLLDDTAQQVWATPLGNGLMVSGVVTVWAGACSLNAHRLPRWQLAAPPLLTVLAAALDDPGEDVWAGGWAFLLVMAVVIGLAAAELWRSDRPEARLQRSTALPAVLVSLFYAGRWIAFVLAGPDSDAFTRWFGTEVATLVTLSLLVAAAFSIAALSIEQQTRELRTRASRDHVTGLLNRPEFLQRATAVVDRLPAGTSASVVLADIDHFKDVNDSQGHRAGDGVLRVFGAACRAAGRPDDLVSRYGGDEFVMLLLGHGARDAELFVERLRAELHPRAARESVTMPTVSYGVATVAAGTALEDAIEAADVALYRAKLAGRDRLVHHDATG